MNETQHKALMLLGLARKARKLEIGEEPCGIACRSGKAKLLLIAHDAGDHTFRRARSYCRAGKPPYLCVPFTKEELGNGLGCNACALCALTDAPFASVSKKPALVRSDGCALVPMVMPETVWPSPSKLPPNLAIGVHGSSESAISASSRMYRFVVLSLPFWVASAKPRSCASVSMR